MDYSFCEGENCPLREACFRWLWHKEAVSAKVKNLRQSYIGTHYDPATNKCLYQIESTGAIR
jgi:hypothetical protein